MYIILVAYIEKELGYKITIASYPTPRLLAFQERKKNKEQNYATCIIIHQEKRTEVV